MITLQEIANEIKKNGKYWIVFTGDSITSCEWVHPNWREIVEYVLKDKLNYDWGLKSFNFAYDGSTTEDLVERAGELFMLNPDLIIAMFGGNDPFLEISLEEYKKNIQNFKSLLDKSGTSIFFLQTISHGTVGRRKLIFPM